MSPFALTAFLAISAVGSNPTDDVARDQVDLIEINHFHDEQGRLQLEQVIFYDWCDEKCRFQVRAWRLLKSPFQMPRRDFRTGGYVAIWPDGDVVREVQAKSVRETWTQYDPEQFERKHLPESRRKDLTKARPAPVGPRVNPAPATAAAAVRPAR